MKILHSAPLDIEISPRLKYAGTERILFYLNKGLSELGNDSFVMGPGNSDLGGYGTLISSRKTHLWVSEGKERKIVRSDEEYEKHYKKCLEFAEKNVDVLHDHPGQFLISSNTYSNMKNQISVPIVTTTHEPIAVQEEGIEAQMRQRKKYDALMNLQREGRNVFLITLSKSHKREYENVGIKVDGVVYNGVDMSLFPLKETNQEYLLWLGRLSPIKGTDLAVQIARKINKPLIIAGEVHGPFQDHFKRTIKPFITKSFNKENLEKEQNSFLEKILCGERVVEDKDILFFGPVDDKQKKILYGNAKVLLQPNRWKEPFGLVPVESMACGTPVIVTNTGALPELVIDGKTGFIVDAEENGKIDDMKIIEGIINVLDKVDKLKPLDCRMHIEDNFSMKRMTLNYINFYNRVLTK